MRICDMRTGISVTVSPTDHARLTAVVRDRNAPQKHVWRARIVLPTADGLGTNAIMRETGKSMTCVWRWQERFAEAGVEGLLTKLSKRRLRRGVFHSIVGIQAAINGFLAEQPFKWTADPDKIIAAVKRGHQASDSIH